MTFLHSHLLEFTFLAISLAGSIMALWGLATAMKDLKALSLVKRAGPIQIVTANRLYQESFRLAIHAVMLVVAVVSVYTAPPPPVYTAVPQTLTSMTAWNVVALLIFLKEVMDRRQRILLDRLYESHYGHPGRRHTDPAVIQE